MTNDRIDQEYQPLFRIQDHDSSYDAISNKIAHTDSESNDNDAPFNRPPVWFVYVVAGCAGINSCNVGFDIGVNSPAGILVQEDMRLSDFQLEMFMGKKAMNAVSSSRIF